MPLVKSGSRPALAIRELEALERDSIKAVAKMEPQARPMLAERDQEFDSLPAFAAVAAVKPRSGVVVHPPE